MKEMLAGLALVLGGCGGLEVAEEPNPNIGDAAPAQEQYCVVEAVAVEPGEEPPSELPPAKLDCFVSFAEAITFATNGLVQLPPDATPDEFTPEPPSAPDVTPTQHVIAIEYEHRGCRGRTLIITSRTTCAQGDIGRPSLSPAWNDVISSARTYEGCRNSYHYEHVNYRGAVVNANCGTSACCNIGDAMNDRTSSIRWTR
ncbi:hypothetical protein [Cystobacter ferrugineus]|uniref:hypothetical protein n=1 Tax=Cystobacter ferrugineus TaxID=83449 RepID=UPI0011611B4C|nr:hypothetical protein [Cystobacter ferrugineus]